MRGGHGRQRRRGSRDRRQSFETMMRYEPTRVIGGWRATVTPGAWHGDLMHTARVCWTFAVAAMVFACGGTLASVRLQPEAPTTLHLGETAAVQVSSDQHYQIGSAGRSLALIKLVQQHDTTIYIYRAIEVGDHTLVAAPREPGPDRCISCVTLHYFVEVIQ
jgi:hypothetical protein